MQLVPCRQQAALQVVQLHALAEPSANMAQVSMSDCLNAAG